MNPLINNYFFEIGFKMNLHFISFLLLDGKLYFNGEKVKSISTFGGEKVFEEDRNREFGVDYNAEGDEEIEIVDNENFEVENKIGHDGGEMETFENDTKKNELFKMADVKKIEPIQSIYQVVGMQEIKNLYEIKPEVAEKFIKEENLKNTVEEFHLKEQDTVELADEIKVIDVKIEKLQKEIVVLGT